MHVHINFVWKISPTRICVKFYPIVQVAVMQKKGKSAPMTSIVSASFYLNYFFVFIKIFAQMLFIKLVLNLEYFFNS